MPNPVMFSNAEALKKGAAIARWKLDAYIDFISSDPQFKEIKDSDFDMDTRNLYNMIPMLIDTSAYENGPEEDKRTYFINEARKISTAFFLTRDKNNPRLPDFKAVEPYIRRFYKEIDIDNNIDWDDEHAIAHLFSSNYSQQTLGTLANDFAGDLVKIFTVEELKKIDNDGAKAYANQNLFRLFLVKENPTISKNMGWGNLDSGTYQFNLLQEIVLTIADASEKGTPIVFDPESSDMTKKYFMSEEFSVEQTGDVSETPFCTHDDIAYCYIDSIRQIVENTNFENALMSATTKYNKNSLLLINGKPIGDLIKEKMTKKGLQEDAATIEVSKQLRKALTDGKSVVTLMRPMIDKDGKAIFKHQELKVDLDKLNEIDRKQTHYSAFRKFLDRFGIWKIQRFRTNEQRDQAQAKQLASSKLQQALRRAEDKFIEHYNMKDGLATKCSINKAYPKLTHIENVENKELQVDVQKTNNEVQIHAQQTNQERHPIEINPRDIDGNTKTETEPPKEISGKTLETTKEIN